MFLQYLQIVETDSVNILTFIYYYLKTRRSKIFSSKIRIVLKFLELTRKISVVYQINNSNRVSESDYSHMVREPRVPQSPVKIPRTYGWLCPYDNYKSDKHYNTQRHINGRHGYGSGEPIDSLTGLTREQKRRNALGQNTSTTNIHGYNYNTNSSSRPSDNAQIQNNSGNQSAFDMPLLDDATKIVRELGYCQNVPTGIQKKTPYGGVRVPGRAQRYMVPPHLQSRKGMNLANSPQPNLNSDPNPYNPTVSHSQYPLSDDLSEAIAGLPQNVLARNLALYNLMKEG